MAFIPKQVAESEVSLKLQRAGLMRVHQGKVRDSFEWQHGPHMISHLLVHTTDRASIFDFVLGQTIPGKGRALTAQTVFWLFKLRQEENLDFDFPENHLVAWGTGVDKFLPRELREIPEIQETCIVVKKLPMLPVEAVVRGHLTGGGLKEYQETGALCGHKLPEGLWDGVKLSDPLFTPTTKAQSGHDESMDYRRVNRKYPCVGALAILIYEYAYQYALERGIILADTKFEFGRKPYGQLVLADEVLTSDGSRLWSQEEWIEAQKQHKSPAGFDKQGLREWGKTVLNPLGGIGLDSKKLNPENEDHAEAVAQIPIPGDVVSDLQWRYKEISRRLGVDKIAGGGILN